MKMLKIMVAALLVAAMVTPAIAEDRLSLNGEFRVRGWHVDVDGLDNTATWGDQRFRLGGKLSVAEGVSITFRTDITESNWGSGNTFGSGRIGVQQWDRAHIDLTKGDFHLRAGQFLTVYGNQFIDNQKNGLSFDVNGAVPVNVFFMVNDDGGSLTEDDAFIYGAKVKPMSNVELLFGGFSDDDEEVYGVGAKASFDLDVVKLAGEVDAFFGDANATQDATGVNVMLDASTALDAATVGAQFFYAPGEDTDVQYTFLGNGFNGWDPIMDVGTSLSNEQISFGNPFDFTGTGAGVVAGRLYAKTKAGAASLGASVAYLTTEEDDVADVDGIAIAAGVVYPVMDNTSFQVQLQYEDFDLNTAGVDDLQVFSAGTGLFVSF